MQELQIGGTANAAPAAGIDSIIEKAPLERYIAPERPSLVGMSRAALAEALAAVRVLGR